MGSTSSAWCNSRILPKHFHKCCLSAFATKVKFNGDHGRNSWIPSTWNRCESIESLQASWAGSCAIHQQSKDVVVNTEIGLHTTNRVTIALPNYLTKVAACEVSRRSQTDVDLVHTLCRAANGTPKIFGSRVSPSL